MLASVVLAAAVAASLPTTFKDYTLGTSLEEFKAKAPPPSEWLGDTTKPVRTVCTNDGVARTWLRAQGDGWVACSFELQYSSGPDRWVRNSVRLSPEVTAAVEFQFYEGRLAIVDASMDVTDESVIEESLRVKFGEPRKLETKDFQVQSGAIFPQRVITWANGADEIVLRAPDLSTKRMSVIYTDTHAVTKWRAARTPASIM
jgi:hypothetical protein